MSDLKARTPVPVHGSKKESAKKRREVVALDRKTHPYKPRVGHPSKIGVNP
jgi:hypothetical protein